MRGDEAAKSLVRVQGLGKIYRGRSVISGLSFSLGAGDMLGLVGANGGGKTTTLRMLAGLVRPDKGEGEVLGYDLRRPCAALRRSVGYMSQRLSLYPDLSVAENLRFRADVFGVDRPATLDGLVNKFGLSEVMPMRFDRLSGGWARRVQFAALLVAHPTVLLLDEPTAGLDVVTRRTIWCWMAELARDGHIVVVSTHDLAEAALCPAILHFADGGAKGPISPATLVADCHAASLEAAMLARSAGPQP